MLFGLLIFFVILLVWSLIPAFLSKVLMKALYGKRVVFGMVLLATILSYVLMSVASLAYIYFVQGGLSGEMVENPEQFLSPSQSVIAFLVAFLVQVIIHTFLAPDDDMEFIAAWKWAIVLLVQTIIGFIIGLLFAFLWLSMSGELSTALLQLPTTTMV